MKKRTYEQIIDKYGKCCICGQKVMKETDIGELDAYFSILLNKKARWEYPTVTAVKTCGSEIPRIAVAIICKSCNSKYNYEDMVDNIKYAIELKNDKLIYHNIEDLEDLDKDLWSQILKTIK